MAEALRSVALRPEQHEAFHAHSLEAELPPAGTRHWVPRYKAAVVAAVEAGVLSLEDAGRRYLLSQEEFESWRDTIGRYGVEGLRMSVQERRTAPRVTVSERGAAKLNTGEATGCLITDVSDRARG